jgi:signal transduction histidine kinase/CheY-like chemotaxis protein
MVGPMGGQMEPSMRTEARFGLTVRTAAAAGAVFVPFVALLVAFSLHYFERRYQDGVASQEQLLVEQLAGDLDDRLAVARDTLAGIARAVPRGLLDKPAALQRFLDERITLHLLFDQGLRMVSPRGELLVESPRDTPGPEVGDDAWERVTRSRAPAFSRPYRTRGGDVTFTVGAPVLDGDGNVVAQLHGAIRAESRNVFGDLSRVRVGTSGYFVVLTRDRIRIAHPDPARILEPLPPGANRAADLAIENGFEGVMETRNQSGVEMLTAARRLRTTDWVFFASLPLQEVRAPFRATRPLYAGAVGLGALLLVGAVWLSLRRVVRPLVEMTAAVERIAASPTPGQRIDGIQGADEVGRLAGSFDRLLDALDAREEARRRADGERRSLEEQLQEQRRLDSLGVLAGGIAHDFNNLLTPIIANASLALQDLPPEHPLRPDMQDIVAAARRGAELARRILAFSRRQVLETRVLDLGQELRATEKALRGALGDGIELRVEPCAERLVVRADPTAIQQALLNLAVNAREAMPHGGTFTLSTAMAGPDAGRRRRPGARYAVVTATDTGAGIDAETLPRIFEPFFTTKGRAKQAGLGLATVHGVLQQHGGDVEVTSAPGQGSSFRLYLPLTDEPAAAAVPAGEPAMARLRVLLVEDEPTVRMLAARILRRAGNEVTEAAAPAEALALPDAARPDLLVTDVLLPGIDGVELHRRLAERWPGLPVLLVSGFPGGNARIEEAVARGEHFLQKPFGPVELLEKVRAAATARPAT